MGSLMDFLSRKKTEQDDRKQALAAGVGTTAALAGKDSIISLLTEAEENRMKSTKKLADFIDKLQPGDVIFSRNSKDARRARPLIKSLTNKDLFADQYVQQILGSFKGDPYYHAQIYTGKDNIIEAGGSGTKVGKKSLYDTPAGALKAYRPNVSEDTKKKAVDYARKQIGIPYSSDATYTKHGILHALNLSGGPKTGGKCNSHVCTSLVGNAYSKHVPNQYASPQQIKDAAKMELIAKYGPGLHAKIPLSEKIATKAIYPIFRNLKYGLGVGGGVYALNKIAEQIKGE